MQSIVPLAQTSGRSAYVAKLVSASTNFIVVGGKAARRAGIKRMVAERLDGKALAQTIRQEVKQEVAAVKDKVGKVPGLAVVLVGSRKDSETYVRNKKKACEEVGIQSFGVDLPEDVKEDELLKVVQDFNADPAVHGILVQLPLPSHINEQRVLDAISIEKDVDGFHPENIGCLAMRNREPLFVSCTPQACIEILDRYNIPLKGRKAVVLGRSNIVGLPVAFLLINRDATVSIIHSKTQHPMEITRDADIVVAAIGQAKMVKGDWIKEGAAVIDVGINSVDDPTAKRGYRLVGDVDFEEVSQKAAYLTPVPGGVGPMTITMLLRNTLRGAKRAFGVE